MAQPWWPAAMAVCLAGGFGTWYSLSDYERARYFHVIVGIPATAFMFLGLLGISGQLSTPSTQPSAPAAASDMWPNWDRPWNMVSVYG